MYEYYTSGTTFVQLCKYVWTFLFVRESMVLSISAEIVVSASAMNGFNYIIMSL